MAFMIHKVFRAISMKWACDTRTRDTENNYREFQPADMDKLGTNTGTRPVFPFPRHAALILRYQQRKLRMTKT